MVVVTASRVRHSKLGLVSGFRRLWNRGLVGIRRETCNSGIQRVDYAATDDGGLGPNTLEVLVYHPAGWPSRLECASA